jgi:Fe-S-cluster containining protein
MEPIDLNAFKASVQAKSGVHKKLFQKLKKVKPKQLDADFQEFHEAAFDCIDCLACANCCKTTGPLFTTQDIDRISKHLRLSASAFMDEYLRMDEDGDYVLQTVPCPFLGADNYCGIYEVRPKACRTYPHTDQNGMHSILTLTRKNAEICPAVDFIADRLKEKYS